MRFVMDPVDDWFVEMGTFFSQRGYVFVYNDVRGCGRSEGDFFPLVDEAWGENRDGYDTVEWVGCQPWPNGNVGLIGTSYGAFNQYTTAPTRPPSLKASMAAMPQRSSFPTASTGWKNTGDGRCGWR